MLAAQHVLAGRQAFAQAVPSVGNPLPNPFRPANLPTFLSSV